MNHDALAIALWDALLRTGNQEALEHFAEVHAKILALTENFEEVEKPIRQHSFIGNAIRGKTMDRDQALKTFRRMMSEMPPQHLVATIKLGDLLCAADRPNGYLGAGSATRLFDYLRKST